MYLDLEDYRPDTPRLESGNSWRGGVLSLVAHIGFVLLIIFGPSALFQPTPQAVVPVQPEQDPVRFVQMMPLKDRVAPPKLQAEASDKDRRATTPEVVPKPENPAPVSHGNTPDKVVGAPAEKPAGPDTPQPAAPSPPAAQPPQQQVAAKVLPDPPVVQSQPAGGALGQSLRNLQRYLQDQNFNNQKGGLTQQDPDIQFDSKGVEFGPWIARFIAQVKSNWFVPDAAMVMSGHVVLAFNVHRDGSISDLRIVTPSTVTAFTNSALGAIKLSNPTMPLPAEYPTEQAQFVVTFHYNEGIR